MNTSKLVNICIIVKKLIKVFADKLFKFVQLLVCCRLDPNLHKTTKKQTFAIFLGLRHFWRYIDPTNPGPWVWAYSTLHPLAVGT